MSAADALPSDEERNMLRDSLRGFLEDRWPAAQAEQRSVDAASIIDTWEQLVGQGVATLGTNPTEGGLREICVVMEELGRAACPAPMLGAALANLAGLPHDESAWISFAFGPFCGDVDGESFALANARATGTLRFVEGASFATLLVVALRDGSLAVVDTSGPGIAATTTRAMGGEGLCEVRLTSSPAHLVNSPTIPPHDLRLIASLCVAARAHGAARRAFEMAVDYAKERRQFGRPIGSFQAIQHKLADCLIRLEGTRRTLEFAALNCDRRTKDWRYHAAAAFAYSATSLRQVSLETHHTFGAIGYSEEHEAPRHFRRVHIDALRYGTARCAREALAAWLLDGTETSIPRYDLGERGNAFRDEVRSWLEQNWSGERKAVFADRPYREREYDESFARELGKTGWIGLAWPRSHGGQERTPLEQVAFIEEMERAEAPRFGASIQANALIQFGTREQQARYLPEILRGEAMYGMGYSEPNAGSDLAALRTRAVRDGGHWVINGQKIWTTTYWGQYMLLGARTDPNATPQHAGIGTFIVPMDTPGITIMPSETMYDGTFANVFYDDVRVPADALLGDEKGGWKVLTSALATERGLVGGGVVMKVAHLFELLCQYVREAKVDGKPLAEDRVVRDRIGVLASEIEVGRQLMMQCAERVQDGVTPPEYAAISKVFSGELMERFGEAALDIIGLPATLSQHASGCIQDGKFEQALRHSLMWVISIGTNEIQRSLIAERALRLPR